jgi:hypothetical protein
LQAIKCFGKPDFHEVVSIIKSLKTESRTQYSRPIFSDLPQAVAWQFVFTHKEPLTPRQRYQECVIFDHWSYMTIFFADSAPHCRPLWSNYLIKNQSDTWKLFRLILFGTKLDNVFNECECFCINPLAEKNIRCHDHCQNNNDCTSGKAERGYVNASLDGWGNTSGKATRCSFVWA